MGAGWPALFERAAAAQDPHADMVLSNILAYIIPHFQLEPPPQPAQWANILSLAHACVSASIRYMALTNADPDGPFDVPSASRRSAIQSAGLFDELELHHSDNTAALKPRCKTGLVAAAALARCSPMWPRACSV